MSQFEHGYKRTTNNSQTWTASAGQLTYVLSGATYDYTHKGFNVYVAGVKQPDDGTAYTKDSATQFTLLCATGDITAGTIVEAVWSEPFVPATAGHNATHYASGQDALDITQLSGYAANVGDKITDNTNKIGNLSEIIVNIKNYDVFTGLYLDGTKLTNVIAANNKKTFYIPDGTYLLNGTVSITNDVCLLLSANAVIQAANAMTDMLNYNVSYSGYGLNRFIRGGIWDGNGLANNCIHAVSAVMLTIDDTVFKNPINRGIVINAGYGILARNLYFNNTIDTNITDNIAIEQNTSDSIFRDIVAANFTVGMKFTSGGNYVNGFHPWGTQAARLSSSIGIDNRALANYFHNIYFDTCAIGLQTTARTDLHECNFLIAKTYRNLFSTQPVYINNINASYVTINQCYFEYTNQGTETYHVTVVSGQTGYVHFRNCDFATPTTLDGIPNYVNQRDVKIFRIAVAFTGWPAVPVASSGGYYEKEVTISNTNFTIAYNDDVSFASNGKWEVGLIPEYYLKDNIVGVRLYNLTSNPITPADRTVWVTITKTTNGSFLPYT